VIEMRKAREADREAVFSLWTRVFGDGAQLQEDFHRLCAPLGETLALWAEGELGAILSPVPLRLRCPNGRGLKAWYLYALAVDPALRGQGFGGVIMAYAAELARQAGADCTLLVPAQPSLFDFFGKLGFERAFFQRPWTPEAEKLSPPGVLPVPIGAAEYNALRREALAGRTCGDWEDGPVEFQQTLSEASGGGLFRLDLPHAPACAAVERTQDAAQVKELLCAPEDLEQAASALAAAFPGRPPRLFLPPWLERGERRAWGMLQWLYGHASPWVPRDESGYFGLAFD